MMFLIVLVLLLIYAVSTPSDKETVHKASSNIASVVRENAQILYERIMGPSTYTVYTDPEDTLDFGPTSTMELIGKHGIFDADDKLEIKTKWDRQ